jgi:hypothetical protein
VVRVVETYQYRGRSGESSKRHTSTEGGVVRVVETYQYRGQKVICVSVKFDFLAFITMVINCTAGMDQKSQKMEVVVAAAERFGCTRLDIRRVTGCV